MAAIVAGAVGGSIPNIFGGFAPFPNTIATALLAYQSEAIGYGFGIKFQYAKRKIGAMTNEEFNALTDFTLGQIVEAHTTELTNRMISEMPRWIEIQDHYIEAGVTVEVMKANRTPSAWAEIITAFAGAASQQVVDSLNAIAPDALSAILDSNPILALIYAIGGGTGGTGGTGGGSGDGSSDGSSEIPEGGEPFHPSDFTTFKFTQGTRTTLSGPFDLAGHNNQANLFQTSSEGVNATEKEYILSLLSVYRPWIKITYGIS